MRALTLSFALATIAPAAMAENLPSGCFAREYSAEHLAAHPTQRVERIVLWTDVATDGENPDEAVLVAWMAKNAYFAAGMRVDGWFLCEGGECQNEGDATKSCGQLQDRGGFIVTGYQKGSGGKSDAVEITTQFLIMNSRGDCAVDASLTEVFGQPTTYRLLRVNEAVCQRVGQ